MTGVPKQKPCKDIQGRKPCEDGGRDCDISYRLMKTRTAGNHQKLEEKHVTDSPSEASKGTNLANILTLNLWPPKLYERKFSIVLSHPFCDSLL